MGIITNRLGIEKPVDSDQFSTETLAQNWQTVDDKTVLFVQNIFANRPAAGVAGRVFVSDDTHEAFYDTGTQWLRISTAAAGGQGLHEKGTAAAPGIGFVGDSNTGIASLAADNVHLVTAGRWHWRVNAQGELGGRNFSSETSLALATQKAGQAHPYWTARVDGQMQWGTGSAAPDVTLYRDATRRLRLTGDLNVTSDLHVGGTIYDGPTGTAVLNFDANTINVGLGQGQARMPLGSQTVPGMSWQGDSDTGFWRRSNGATSWSGSAVEGGYLHGGGVRTVDGTLGRPAYSFINDINSGMYSGGDGNVRLVANAITRLEVAGSRTSVLSNQFRAPNGSKGAPGIHFDDPDTGFYHNGSLNQVGLSVDGVNEILVGKTGTYIRNAYYYTTSSGANVNVSSDGGGAGRLARVSSLRAHKTNITPLEGPGGASIMERGMQVEPISFTSLLPNDDPDTVHLGLVAEDVHEVMPELVVYDSDGEPSSVAYDRIGVLALAYAQQALRRLDQMEDTA